jgi:hypothetical protein
VSLSAPTAFDYGWNRIRGESVANFFDPFSGTRVLSHQSLQAAGKFREHHPGGYEIAASDAAQELAQVVLKPPEYKSTQLRARRRVFLECLHDECHQPRTPTLVLAA